jgi:hypothetical protein
MSRLACPVLTGGGKESRLSNHIYIAREAPPFGARSFTFFCCSFLDSKYTFGAFSEKSLVNKYKQTIIISATYELLQNDLDGMLIAYLL